MRQGALFNISFEPQLITQAQQTWSVDRYKQGQYLSEIIEQFGGLGLRFRPFSI